MPEFLVRVDGASKFIRVHVRGPNEIALLLEDDWMYVTAFSISGQAFRLEPGKVLKASHDRLPRSVKIAWFGVRFARARFAFQVCCWLVLGIIFGLAREAASPTLLILTGLANIFAWWWSESDRSRIEPGVHQARGF